MEQQHPIPQQISSYQFRLVGDMTLKQFFQVAGGLLVSLLIYSTNLHVIIKWPLILLFALFGVALAFLPFQDRPLEKWILAFFRSVYSPTLYYWRRGEKVPVFFQNEAPAPEDNVVAPHGEAVMKKYLEEAAGRGSSIFGKLEEAEQTFLSKMTSLLGIGSTPAQPQPTTPIPTSQPVTKQAQTGQPGNIIIPEAAPTRVVEQKRVEERPKLVVEEKRVVDQTTGVSPTFVQQRPQATQAAQFSAQSAPPTPPERPNTVVGQVLDTEGKIVESAILEIRDVAGRPVRAVKTNRLGHFIIVTPLQNGTYEIITEKSGLEFGNLSFEAKGTIIPPISIQARKKLITEEVN